MEIRVEVWKTAAPVDEGDEFYVIVVGGWDDLILAAKGPFNEEDARRQAGEPEGFVRGLFDEAAQKIWQEAQFVEDHRQQFERV